MGFVPVPWREQGVDWVLYLKLVYVLTVLRFLFLLCPGSLLLCFTAKRWGRAAPGAGQREDRHSNGGTQQ